MSRFGFSPLSADYFAGNPQLDPERLVAMQPLAIKICPEDVASAALFLALDMARCITAAPYLSMAGELLFLAFDINPDDSCTSLYMRKPIDERISTLQHGGVIGFGVTPFHDDFTINCDALRQTAANLAENCDLVVPLGNNGDVFSLSPIEQQHIGKAVVDEIAGRKPVIVGLAASLPTARELARAAEDYGASAILILPPYGVPANDDGLFDYYRSVAEAVSIRVFLFQTPAFNFSLSLLRRLAEIPNIIGMKDEHGDMKQFVRQLAAVGDRMELLCGVGEILAPSYFGLGVKTFTSGIVNFMPQTPLKIVKLLREGCLQEAARLVEKDALPVFDLRAKRPGYTTVVIKEAMRMCGMPVGPVRPPLAPLLPEDRQVLRATLHEFRN